MGKSRKQLIKSAPTKSSILELEGKIVEAARSINLALYFDAFKEKADQKGPESIRRSRAEYFNIYAPEFVALARVAVNELPLRADTNEGELVRRLSPTIWYARRWKRFKNISKRTYAKQYVDLSKAIDALVQTYSAAHLALNWLQRASIPRRKSGEFHKYDESVTNLEELKGLIDALPGGKPGNVVSKDSRYLGITLANFYYDATRMTPALRSGSRQGRFYRLVSTVVANTAFNSNTVTRKGVEYWKSKYKTLPRCTK